MYNCKHKRAQNTCFVCFVNLGHRWPNRHYGESGNYSTDSIWETSLLASLWFPLPFTVMVGCSVDGLGAVWTIFGTIVMGWSSSAKSSEGSSSMGVNTSTWTGASSGLRNLNKKCPKWLVNKLIDWPSRVTSSWPVQRNWKWPTAQTCLRQRKTESSTFV